MACQPLLIRDSRPQFDRPADRDVLEKAKKSSVSGRGNAFVKKLIDGYWTVESAWIADDETTWVKLDLNLGALGDSATTSELAVLGSAI